MRRVLRRVPCEARRCRPQGERGASVTRRDPPGVAILAARLARAYPALSAFSAASLAAELLGIERAQRRHAERCCAGEDGGYVKRGPIPGREASYGVTGSYVVSHDPDAEQRASERIEKLVHAWNKRLAELHGKAWTMKLHAYGCWRCTLQDGPAHKTVIAEWCIELRGDPRGPVLLLRLPGDAEAVAV